MFTSVTWWTQTLTPDSGLLKAPILHATLKYAQDFAQADALLPASPATPTCLLSSFLFLPTPLSTSGPKLIPLPSGTVSPLASPHPLFLPFCDVYYHNHCSEHPSPTPADQHLSVCLSFKALITRSTSGSGSLPGHLCGAGVSTMLSTAILTPGAGDSERWSAGWMGGCFHSFNEALKPAMVGSVAPYVPSGSREDPLGGGPHTCPCNGQSPFLGLPLLVWWLSIHLPMRGTRVRSLVGELRFRMQGHVLHLLTLRATTREPVCHN